MALSPTPVTVTWDATNGWQMFQPTAPTIGVQAYRASDLTRLQGMNTFMGIDADTNVFGAWPGDNSQASVKAGAAYLGIKRTRDYFRAQFRSWQEPWGKAVRAASGIRFSITPASGASLADAQALGAMAIASSQTDGWIEQIEGALEPNNFKIPPDQAVAMQKALWTAGQQTKGNKWPVRVAGPSVVIGMPHPEGWIMPIGTPPAGGYFSAAQMIDIRANMDTINLHFYAPYNADLASGGRGGWLQDTVAGVKAAYGDLPISMTECNTTLYTSTGHYLDPAYDAYYTALLLFSAFREKIDAVHYYSMVNFGQQDVKNASGVVIGKAPIYASGLFPKTGGVAPRPVAATLQAISSIMQDGAPDQDIFIPDSLGVTVSGLPSPLAGAPNSGGSWMLFQSRQAGVFILALINSQAAPGGTTSPVTVTFAKPVARVQDSNVTDIVAPKNIIQDVTNASSVTIPLNGSVHLLRITV